MVLFESCGEDVAVAEPPSDCSDGICTLSRGRFESVAMLSLREGGPMSCTEEIDER